MRTYREEDSSGGKECETSREKEISLPSKLQCQEETREGLLLTGGGRSLPSVASWSKEEEGGRRTGRSFTALGFSLKWVIARRKAGRDS